MNIVVQGTNVELTPALREFVSEKIVDALRPFGDMREDPALGIEVELEADTGHHRKGDDVFRAEVNLSVRGSLIRAEATAEDMYKAITRVKHKLTREIRHWRERRLTGARDGARAATALQADENVPTEPIDDWAEEDDSSG